MQSIDHGSDVMTWQLANFLPYSPLMLLVAKMDLAQLDVRLVKSILLFITLTLCIRIKNESLQLNHYMYRACHCYSTHTEKVKRHRYI